MAPGATRASEELPEEREPGGNSRVVGSFITTVVRTVTETGQLFSLPDVAVKIEFQEGFIVVIIVQLKLNQFVLICWPCSVFCHLS